ncbi:hypothetical protein M5E88_00315 [Akkermansia muciniphila]|nr:hypothetical protein M5E88_00315 [Akkermansia muciniphila]
MRPHRFPKNGINKERNNMYRRPEHFLLLRPHAGGDIRIPGKQDFSLKNLAKTGKPYILLGTRTL